MNEEQAVRVYLAAWEHPHRSNVGMVPRGDGTFFVVVWWRYNSLPTTITSMSQWRAMTAPREAPVTIRPAISTAR